MSNAYPSKKTRNSQRSGPLLLVFAIISGVIVVLGLGRWSNDPAGFQRFVDSLLGGPTLSLSSTSLTSDNSRPAEMPRARTGLVLTSQNRGQVLFGRYCDSCHTGGREFAGPSFRTSEFKSEYASPDSIIKVVRAGGFDMPAFSDNLISDDDLRDIVQYVLSLPQDNP